MTIPETVVPCKSCTACCRDNPGIFLHPDKGDDLSSYQTIDGINPLTEEPSYRLAVKANGDCVYLGDSGCSIYDRRPIICRSFDCRKQYAFYPKKLTRQMIDEGHFSQAISDAGRSRVHTLSSEERRICFDRRNEIAKQRAGAL